MRRLVALLKKALQVLRIGLMVQSSEIFFRRLTLQRPTQSRSTPCLIVAFLHGDTGLCHDVSCALCEWQWHAAATYCRGLPSPQSQHTLDWARKGTLWR